MMSTEVGNKIIDWSFDLVGGIATVGSFVYGTNAPLIHIQFPPVVLHSLQAGAFCVSMSVGMLTLMNMLGYEPRWLKSVKSYFKNKSKS